MLIELIRLPRVYGDRDVMPHSVEQRAQIFISLPDTPPQAGASNTRMARGRSISRMNGCP
ncbi:hypothetical protein [Mycolicibacterium lutetiense]|uniref:Uncharacterized protein n=1 Tax=Mycolicibacterium lutetiense TaxID=1641992 RepID=A0ABS4ZWS0_9MYCO|nr:hypothetical protein [Mycolicibacterium lutetiense]MBP2453593.1 hypothetical protein [Mycolicibacterium lutetiense]